MNPERKQILDMLAAGKINADEAERLMSAMDGAVMTLPPRVAGDGQKPRPKYLRVTVDTLDKGDPVKVNIRVPMTLLYAGVKLSALMPPEARDKVNEALRTKGIPFDMAQLKPENLEDLVDQLNDLTVDVDQEGTKVRIYCE